VLEDGFVVFEIGAIRFSAAAFFFIKRAFCPKQVSEKTQYDRISK